MRRTLIVVVAAILFVAACSSAASPNPAPDSQGKPGEGVTFPEPSAAASAPTDRLAGGPVQPMIVRVGEIELQVTDVNAAYRQARELALRLGGYVGDSQLATKDGRPFATVVLRIPAERYDDALDALRPLATKVVAERSQETDVTSQVVDLNARLVNLRATETALQKLMDQATKVSDILAVQHELSTVREQIEQLTAQQQELQKQAALSTLTVSLETTPQPVSEIAKTWDPGSDVQQAVASLVDIVQGLGRLAIWLVIVVLPIALGAGFVFAVAWFLSRRLRIGTRRPAYGDGPPPAPPA